VQCFLEASNGFQTHEHEPRVGQHSQLLSYQAADTLKSQSTQVPSRKKTGVGGVEAIPEIQARGNLRRRTQRTFSEILGVAFLRDVDTISQQKQRLSFRKILENEHSSRPGWVEL